MGELFPELSMSNVYSFRRDKNRIMFLGSDFPIRFNYFRKGKRKISGHIEYVPQ